MTKKIYILGFLIITSILLQAYLSKEYYAVQYGHSTGDSVCNINEVLNCDAVAASEYSNLFGIPNAILGLFLNFILLISLFGFLLSSDDSENARKWSQFFFWLNALSFVSSLLMAFISFFIIKKLCIFCMSLYVISAILFFLSFKFFKEHNPSSFENLGTFFKDKALLGLLIAVPALGFVSHKVMKAEYSPAELENEIRSTLTTWKDSPENNFDLKPLLQINPGAPVKIAEFADFLCSHCATASFSLKSFLKLHDNIEFSFYAYPLDPICNPNMNQGYKSPGHSCTLAAGVHCAEVQGQGGPLHDDIFKKQNEYRNIAIKDKKKGLIDAMSRVIPGVDVEKWKTCVDSADTIETLKTSALLGEKAKVRGTPTIFLNGKKLRGGANFLILKEAYKSIK